LIKNKNKVSKYLDTELEVKLLKFLAEEKQLINDVTFMLHLTNKFITSLGKATIDKYYKIQGCNLAVEAYNSIELYILENELANKKSLEI